MKMMCQVKRMLLVEDLWITHYLPQGAEIALFDTEQFALTARRSRRLARWIVEDRIAKPIPTAQ